LYYCFKKIKKKKKSRTQILFNSIQILILYNFNLLFAIFISKFLILS